MIYIVKINNKEYEVEVEKGQANLIKTSEIVAPAPTTQAVPVETPVQASTPVAPAHQMAGESIKAPLPGTVIDIKADVGKKVKRGEILLILEAMKMENEIVAPFDGVVAQVIVSKGAAVATNEVLMIIQ